MGGDEIFVTFIGAGGALAIWGYWLAGNVAMSNAYYRNSDLKWVSGIAGCVVAVFLFVILKLWASHDVRNAPQYLAQYWGMGAFIAGFAAVYVFPILGLSYRDDVCENRNPAAAFAWVGATTGFTLAYAGSNIGDGPGWWVVVFCAGMACGFLTFLWFLLEVLCHISERITVDRDLGAGMRFSGLMAGMGIVVGRGAAGNWTNTGNAIADFVSVVGPALPLAVTGAVVEALLRPRPNASWRETTLLGAIPGLLFLAGGLFYVVLLKPW